MKICKCGNHFFSCSRVRVYDVEISSISDAELESSLADEYLKPPYICTQCGAEYKTLDDEEMENV